MSNLARLYIREDSERCQGLIDKCKTASWWWQVTLCGCSERGTLVLYRPSSLSPQTLCQGLDVSCYHAMARLVSLGACACLNMD